MACTCRDVATNVESKNIKLMSLYTCIVFTSMILYVSPCIRVQNAQESKTRSQSDRVDQEFDIKSDAKKKFSKYERVV